MNKIYFACSIRGGRNDVDSYGALVKHIKTNAIVLSEIFTDEKLTVEGSTGDSKDIYANDIAWIHQADAMIAEVTNPSLGVGYEIAKAEEWNKPILALFRDDGTRKLSAMIDSSPRLQIKRYTTIFEAQVYINQFLKSI